MEARLEIGYVIISVGTSNESYSREGGKKICLQVTKGTLFPLCAFLSSQRDSTISLANIPNTYQSRLSY